MPIEFDTTELMMMILSSDLWPFQDRTHWVVLETAQQHIFVP